MRYIAAIYITIVSILLLSLPCYSQNTENSDFLVARKSFRDGFYEVALKAFEKFIAENPNDTNLLEARLLMGESLVHLSRFNDAMRELNAVIESDKDARFTDEAIYWKAEIYLRTRDFENAEELCNELIREFPSSKYVSYAKHSIAWSFYERGLYGDALAAFSDFLSSSPPRELVGEARLKKGEILHRTKKYEESNKALRELVSKEEDKDISVKAYFYIAENFYYLRDYKQAIEAYTKAMSAGPDSEFYMRAAYGKAWSYIKIGKHKNAIDEFKVIKTLGKDNSMMDYVLFGEAQALNEMEKFDEALKSYNQIINEFSDSEWLPNAYLGKGESLYRLGLYEDALLALKDGIDRFPSSEYVDDMKYNMGWVYFKLGRFEEAVEEFSDVIKDTDSDFYRISSYCRLGDSFVQMQAMDRALDAYDMVLKEANVNPEAVFGYVDYAQYQIGRILFQLERYEGAILAFQSLLKNYPESGNSEDAKFGLAIAYFKKGDYGSSIRELRSFLAEFPDSKYKEDAKFQLASSFYNISDYAKALDIFNQIAYARDYGSESARRYAVYEIGWCHYKLGDTKKALSQFESFIASYPQDDLSQDARFWMGEYYAGIGDYDRAKKSFKDLIRVFPRGSLADDAEYRLALIYHDTGDENESVKTLDKLKDDFPNSELIPNADLKLAEIFMKQRNYIKAKEILSGFMTRFDGTAYIKVASKYFGDILRRENKLREAVEYYKKAIDSRRGDFNAAIQYIIGEIYEELGEHDNAVTEYMKVGYIYPDSTKIVIKAQLACARIFEKQKKWEEAAKLYKKVSVTDVDESAYASERLNWIKRNKK